MEDSVDTRLPTLLNTLGASQQDTEPMWEEDARSQDIKSHQRQEIVVNVPPCSTYIKDHMVWSLFNMVYMNFCCLGLVALVYSVKSRDQTLNGNPNEAKSHGSSARSLNIASTVGSIFLLIVFFILFLTGYIHIRLV